ncbi:hypothetical protein [Microcoleus sp. FACHB-68]|uniref:hypothetical protein n=1 Tax=Microcoleus sp. FACHB-68 TaxID=2692826 RepID=UPI001687B90A|nr:hypothetical protein [Microcoleus sp. FACHB-68]MBD1937787.1 hypothetical protein [Microcoleus sp. FACHB-68]
MTQPVTGSFILERMRPEDAVDTVEKDIHRLQLPAEGDERRTVAQPKHHQKNCRCSTSDSPKCQLRSAPKQ